MGLIFNELSCYPPASDGHQLAEKFHLFLCTFRSAQKKYMFNRVLFPQDFSTQQVTEFLIFVEWINTPVSRNLRDSLLSIIRKPFIDDLDDDVTYRFFSNDYIVDDPQVPIKSKPVGLPIAYIKEIPTISLSSHPYWENRKITICVAEVKEPGNSNLVVYNLCYENDLETMEIEEWGRDHLARTLKKTNQLKNYLNFGKYKIEFYGSFFEQLLSWKVTAPNTFKRILELMQDVEENPFTGGLGRTEALKYSNKASKRTTHGDRLVYSLKNDIVTFYECTSHYNDH